MRINSGEKEKQLERMAVMKIISITSSFRRNGNTERLVSLIEEELQLAAEVMHEPLEIERISLANVELGLCQGCRACFDNGEEMCPRKDDVLLIRDKISEADGVILASPVYVEDVNGIMKNWIDRMAFNCHRPAFAGKTAVVVTSSAAGSTNHAIKTMSNALTAWGFFVEGQHKFRLGAFMETQAMKVRYGTKIKRAAEGLLNNIKNQKALKPSFYSLTVFKIQQKYWQKRKDASNTFDYTYWSSKGWFEPQCEYYISNEASWIKVKAARLFGSIIAMFFI